MAVIKLLRYLSEKYFSEFNLMDAVSDALSNMKFIPGENPQSLADRIEHMLKDKFNKE